MIISAWGTGYKARYLRISARLDHQDYFGQTLLFCVSESQTDFNAIT